MWKWRVKRVCDECLKTSIDRSPITVTTTQNALEASWKTTGITHFSAYSSYIYTTVLVIFTKTQKQITVDYTIWYSYIAYSSLSQILDYWLFTRMPFTNKKYLFWLYCVTQFEERIVWKLICATFRLHLSLLVYYWGNSRVLFYRSKKDFILQ